MASPLHNTLTSLAVLGLSVSPTVVSAETQWLACPVAPHPAEKINRPSALPNDAVYIEANRALFREKGVSDLSGNVHVSQNGKKMRADNATYEKLTAQITGTGNVVFGSDTLNATSTDLRYNMNQDAGEMNNADYALPQTGGRGSSKRVIRENAKLTRLEQALYTACPPGNIPAWSLNSPNIRLQHDQEQGIAKDVTLKIKRTPILYLPYLSFPLTDKRKSGFLFPTLGSTEKTGLQAGIPYYFNLAPNYDMTLTPTVMSKRGIQLEGEFRYLTKQQEGQARLALLPNDRGSDKGDRYYYKFSNKTQLDPRSSLALHAEGVSDSAYFTDLGNSLQATSIVNLEKRLRYQTSGDHWSFSALTQDYQVLDGGTKPHARLPQLSLNYKPLPSGSVVDVNVDTEYTKFARSKTASNGERLDTKVTASKTKTFANDAIYFKPSVSVRHSEYALDDANNTRLHRTLPTASLEAGVFFEREVKQGQYLQTLEPRIYYTQTPYKDQSAIPVFDSSENTFSYGQVFTENRFSGKDRIEDANRLSFSVTTRLQDQKAGRETIKASVGQIYHFDDRQVTLPGQTAQTGKRSELVLETGGQINPRTNVSSTTFWDSDTQKLTANQVDIRYKDEKKRTINLGYTKRRDDFESARVSFSTPTKHHWKAIGGVEQDLLNNRNLETVLGAEYESCCWKTRIANRNYLTTDNKTRDNAIFIEFELKGLGNFGNGTRSLFQDRVYGYE